MVASAPASMTRSDVLTVPEAAAMLRVSARHVYALVARGEMPGAKRLGRRVLISRSVVEGWLAAP